MYALPLERGDVAVDLRIFVFVDRTFVEVFALGGRVAVNAPVPQSPAASAAAGMLLLSAGADAAASNVAAWAMTSAVVPLEEVLRAAAESRQMRSKQRLARQ